MKSKQSKQRINPELPTIDQLKIELGREKYKRRYRSVFRSTIYTLIVVAAAAVLLATVWMPVLQIYGGSMSPMLNEGDIVLAIKGSDIKNGELAAFYIGNKILVKRCIALPGQTVEIDEGGNVTVDGEPVDEPYLTEKALGDCNIEFPYQVPDNRYFFLGDRRTTSVDSRNTAVGCISEEQLIGKIIFRVWPLSGFGAMK
ncbi:MAG: signal peptidase I [Candidatus Flemingiibacterium sp.]